MHISKTKRAVNFLIFIGLFVFLYQISGQATDQMDRASGAISDIQARAR